MSKIFISYRREDSADVTGRIYDRLIREFDRASVFKDVDSIPLGVDFRTYLDEQVAKCDAFLAVIGRAWKGKGGSRGSSRLGDTQDFVRIEIESALQRGIPVIPVLVGGASIPPVEQLPESMRDLSYRNGIAVRSDPDFHRDMDRLIEQLKTQIQVIEEQLEVPDAAAQDMGKDVKALVQEAHSGFDQFPQESVLELRAPSGPTFQEPQVKQPQEQTPSQAKPAFGIESLLDSTSKAEQEGKLLEQIPSTPTTGPAAMDSSGARQRSQAHAQTTTGKRGDRSGGAPATAGAKQPQPYIFVGVGLLGLIGAVMAYWILSPGAFSPKSTVPPSPATLEAGRPQSQVSAPASEPRFPTEKGTPTAQSDATVREEVPGVSSMATEPRSIDRSKQKSSGKDGPPMVRISLGQFRMGSLKRPEEAPVHEVRFTKPFAMARYETTFEEYDRFAQATGRELPDDEGWDRGRRPVINVSWQDAKDYAAWLSGQTGKRYRLPSESEWEYAARSGGQDEIWAGTSEKSQLNEYVVWNTDRTAPVGTKKPNGLGLYDMSGNVDEWVEDCWHDNYKGAPTEGSVWLDANAGACGQRVIRGGSFGTTPFIVRAPYRGPNWADYRDIPPDCIGCRIGYRVGFRLAQDIS